MNTFFVICVKSCKYVGAHSSLPLWPVVWTTATQCCMARPLQSHADYRCYWMPPLAWSSESVSTSTSHRWYVTLSTGCQWPREYSSRLLLWHLTVSKALVSTISSKLSVQSLKCHVGHSVLPAAATCSFRGQTRPSANKVFLSRLLLSGTHFHPTYAHRTSVANSSDQSWKLVCSDKPTTLHDSSENNLLKSETL